ncbi:MAG: DUF4442 domain-containing protein [Cyclobacteriaceae bacterium]
MNEDQKKLIRKITQPIPFFWFMLLRLPSVAFWKIKVKSLTLTQCQTTLPFTWRTQNPFGSIYFSALAGSAELASGLLCMLHLAGGSKFSMLVTDFQATFHKKAVKTVIMHCNDGLLLKETLNQLKAPGDTAIQVLTIEGKDSDGVPIGSFKVTWSFKRK